MSRRSPDSTWLLGLLALGVAVHGPLLWGLARHLWGEEHYQHFPIIIGAALWLAYQRWSENPLELVARPSISSVLLTLAHLPLLAAAYAANSHWLGAVSFLFFLAGVVLGFGGWGLARCWLGPWFLLWLCLPLPLEQDVALVTGLQQIAAGFASGMLDLAGLRHGISGVAIQGPQQIYFVAEACSGVNSLFSSMAFMAFYFVYRRYHWLRILLGLAQTVVWVIIINSVRVFLVVYSEERLGIPLAEGWAHQVLGGLGFTLILGLSISGDFFLMALLPRMARDRVTVEAPSAQHAARSLKSPAYPAVVASLTIVAAIAGLGATMARGEQEALGGTVRIVELQRDALPASFGSWRLRNFELIERTPGHIEGLASAAWEYEDGANAFVFSMDGPFSKWHDLAYCYQALDWRLVHGANKSLAVDPNADPEPFTVLEFFTPRDQRAWVLFCCYDATNQAVEPLEPSGNLLRRLLDRVKSANPFSNSPRRVARPPIIQAQLAVTSSAPLYEHERQKLEEIFDQFRRRVRQDSPSPQGT